MRSFCDQTNSITTKHKNLALLIISVFSKTTSSSTIETAIGTILRNHLFERRNQSTTQNKITMAFLTNTLRSDMGILGNQQFPMTEIFDLWKSLAWKVQRGEFDNDVVNLSYCLEIIISRTLLKSEEDAFLSSKLYISIDSLLK